MKKSLLLLFAALFIAAGAMAQTDYVVYQGTETSYSDPTYNCWKYSFNEYVINYSNMPSPGYVYNKINSISFYFTGTYNSSTATSYTCNMVVYMKNVARTGFTSSDNYEPVTLDDRVFVGTVTATHEGWVTLNLQCPFYYNNTPGNHLLIAIDNNTGIYTGTGATNWAYFGVTTTSDTRGVRFYSDDADIDPYGPSSSVNNSLSNNLPNLKINYSVMSVGDVATMPYYCDFEDATERGGWLFKNTNDNMNAGWYIWGPSNDHRLMCGGGQDDYQTSGQPVTVLAERAIMLSDADQIAVRFKVNVGGEGGPQDDYENNCYDYVMAFLAPYSEEWQPYAVDGTTTYTGSSDMWDVPYALHFGSNTLLGTKLVHINNQYVQTIFDNPAPGQKYKLIFVWHNDGSDGDGTAATIDNIQVVDYVEYDIKVGNTLVTSLNCNDITDSDLVSGHIYFTPATNTITMNGATLDTEDGLSINDGDGGLPIENPVIELIGENDVLGGIDLDSEVSEEYTGLLKINGSGSLSAVGLWLAENVNLLVKDCELDFVTQNTWCVYGYGNNVFTFNNAKAHFKAGSYALGDISELNLVGCEITLPENALITSTETFLSVFVCNSDGTAATEVMIERTDGIGEDESTMLCVMPNPANDVIRVSGLNGTEEVNIYNTLGQLVKSARLSDGQDLNISDLSAGIYMLRGENSAQMVKFTVK